LKVYCIGKPPHHIWICAECREEYERGITCKHYLEIKKQRIRDQAKLRNLSDISKIFRKETRYYDMIYGSYRTFSAHEQSYLNELKPLIVEQPNLWNWIQIVSGQGPVAASTYLSYIRTHYHIPICRCGKDLPQFKKKEVRCRSCGEKNNYKKVSTRRVEVDTAGKARAYFGLVPGAKLRSGKPGGFNPEAKGRVLGMIIARMLQATGRGPGDSYYIPLLDAKKYYYYHHSRYDPVISYEVKTQIINPKNCPDYAKCKGKACKKHIDLMAKRWLGGILVSHATELIRRDKGLDTSLFKRHRGYIHPKAFKEETVDKNILEQIKTGHARKYW